MTADPAARLLRLTNRMRVAHDHPDREGAYVDRYWGLCLRLGVGPQARDKWAPDGTKPTQLTNDMMDWIESCHAAS